MIASFRDKETEWLWQSGKNRRLPANLQRRAFKKLAILNAAVTRADVKRNPFHPFSCFDTATLAGAALGQTVLAKAVTVAGLDWDPSSAHSAAYDAERSADIFCLICNRFRDSYREAEERARALGWLNAPATEPASEDPQMETE